MKQTEKSVQYTSQHPTTTLNHLNRHLYVSIPPCSINLRMRKWKYLSLSIWTIITCKNKTIWNLLSYLFRTTVEKRFPIQTWEEAPSSPLNLFDFIKRKIIRLIYNPALFAKGSTIAFRSAFGQQMSLIHTFLSFLFRWTCFQITVSECWMVCSNTELE